MIDHEKLKELHILATKHYAATGEPVVLELNFSYGCASEYHIAWINNVPFRSSNFDGLINYLKGLIEPEPDYKTGWYLKDGEIKHTKFMPNPPGIFCACDETNYDAIGTYLYDSIDQLIQSQIDYWTSMQKEEISTSSEYMSMVSACEHESDGYLYLVDPPKNKCKKCGDFYR